MGAGLLCLLTLAADLDVGAGRTYATIGEALAAAQPGDSILVAAGTYAEDLDLGASGMEGSPIRIESIEPGAAVVQGAIDIGGSEWELVGLTIETPPDTDGIQITGARIVLDGLEMSGGTRDGVDGGGQDVTIRNCLIHDYDAGDSDAHCIVLNPGAERWTIEDSELYDCSGDGVQLYSESVERTIIDTTIQRNLIYYTGAIARTENAVDVKNADGLVIRDNVMWGFFDNKTLVFQKGPANIEVSCNQMLDGFTGVEFRGEDGGTIETIVFAHNLMVGFEQYALKFDGTAGAEVFNNTFVDVDGDGLRLEGASLTAGEVRNNAWINATQIESDGDFEASHNAFWMVADNEIGSADDVLDDPMLDADYRLVDGSPLVDAGVDVGLPFEGDAPDIGWDELGGGPCQAAPVPPDDDGRDDDDDDDDAVDDTAGTDGGDGSGPGDDDDDDDATTGGTADGGSDGAEAQEGESNGCGCQANHRQMPLWAALMVLPGLRRRRVCQLGGRSWKLTNACNTAAKPEFVNSELRPPS